MKDVSEIIAEEIRERLRASILRKSKIKVELEIESKPKFANYNGCKIEVDGRQIGKIAGWTVGSVRDLDNIYDLKESSVDFVPHTGSYTLELTRRVGKKEITDN